MVNMILEVKARMELDQEASIWKNFLIFNYSSRIAGFEGVNVKLQRFRVTRHFLLDKKSLRLCVPCLLFGRDETLGVWGMSHPPQH